MKLDVLIAKLQKMRDHLDEDQVKEVDVYVRGTGPIVRLGWDADYDIFLFSKPKAEERQRPDPHFLSTSTSWSMNENATTPALQ